MRTLAIWLGNGFVSFFDGSHEKLRTEIKELKAASCKVAGARPESQEKA